MNANEIFLKMIDDFVESEIPIPVDKIQKTLSFCNSTSYLGYCQLSLDGFVISISQVILRDEEMLKTTLAHELVHTCPDCFNHGPEFVKIGKMVEEKLGITISTKDFDISEIIKQRAKYALICPQCEYHRYLQRKSKRIKSPEYIVCPNCGKTGLILKNLREDGDN